MRIYIGNKDKVVEFQSLEVVFIKSFQDSDF